MNDHWKANPAGRSQAAGFPSTNWGLIDFVKSSGASLAPDAVNELMTKYWRPIFYFIRMRGYPRTQAEDLTQDFFLRFLEKDWIQRADPDRGRFRTYMITILIRFLSDQSTQRVSKQARFERGLLSIESLMTESDRSFEPSTEKTPEHIFEERWRETIVDGVLAQLRDSLQNEGKSVWFELFESNLLRDQHNNQGQSELARKHGLSRDQVRYAIAQVRQQFIRVLSAELRFDGATDNECQAELSDLLRAIGSA